MFATVPGENWRDALRARDARLAVLLGGVALGVVNLRLIQKRVFREPDISQGVLPRGAVALAATSLLLWFGAVTSGRLLAYIGGPASGLK